MPRQQERRTFPVEKIYVCDKCGKVIEAMKYNMDSYTYKRKADKQIKYYCCYNHMRVAQLEEEAAKQAKKLAQRKAGNK